MTSVPLPSHHLARGACWRHMQRRMIPLSTSAGHPRWWLRKWQITQRLMLVSRLVGLTGTPSVFLPMHSLSLNSPPSFALLLVTRIAPTLLTFTSIWLLGKVRLYNLYMCLTQQFVFLQSFRWWFISKNLGPRGLFSLQFQV